MKKILVSFAIIAFFSCNKETIEHNNTIDYKLPKVDLFEVLEQFTDEFAYFENEEIMVSFLSQFNSLQYEEKSEIVELLKYKTLDHKLDEYYETMNSFETEEEFYNLIKSTNGLLTISDNEEGEKEVFESGVSKHSIYTFLNKDMIVKVGSVYHKYFNKYLVKSESYNTLIEYHYDLKTHIENDHNIEKVVTIIGNPSMGIIKRDDVGTPYSWEKKNLNGGCRHHRKATMTVWFSEEEHNYYTEYFREAELVAKRKGIPCIWYKYNTHIIWTNFDMTYTQSDNQGSGILTHFWTKNFWECESCKSREYKESIGAPIKPIIEEFDWVNVQSHISTLGVGPYAIDHNF